MKPSRTLVLVPVLLAAGLAAPATAAVHDASAPTDGTLLTYSAKQGSVSLLTVDDSSKLPGAPAAFRKFAKSSMNHEWRSYFKGRPACKAVPRITVTALRTDGYALGYVNDQPQPGCQSGGGYEAIWAVRKDGWKQVIGTQDVPNCSRLEKLGVPSEIGVDQCYDGKDVVTYTHA